MWARPSSAWAARRRSCLRRNCRKKCSGLYWAKNMYWRAGKPERFVRPVRWVVALLDSEIVPLEIAGIAAGNASRGHRVLHGAAPCHYRRGQRVIVEALRAAYVVVDVAERRHIIRKALDAATRTVAGARWREDEALVETVVHLTEWPTVVLGDFEAEYLDLPEEVLVTVMRDHQKYFAVEGADGKLAPHFLAVLNTQVDAEGASDHPPRQCARAARAVQGCAVLLGLRPEDPAGRARREPEERDLPEGVGQLPLEDRAEIGLQRKNLQRRPYHVVSKLDEAALLKATELAKTDLTTELVKEFTELQGIIGGLYARAQGHGESVAQAIYDQYTPASTEDRDPVDR